MIKFIKRSALNRIQETLPCGMKLETDEPLTLKGGKIFTFRIVDGEKSVVIFIDGDSEKAHKAKMCLVHVEEDRYEPRWRETFGCLENAVARAGYILRNGRTDNAD